MDNENKFWQHSKFDTEGNEISYEDNRGKRYAFDQHNGNLSYYNNLSQALLDQLPTTSDDPHEQLFLDLFSNLYMIKNDRFHDLIVFKNNIDNEVLMEYNLKNRYFYIHYDKIWSFFETKYRMNYEQIQDFMKSRLDKYLNLTNTTPAAIKLTIGSKLDKYLNLTNTTPRKGHFGEFFSLSTI